jgi:hypothetical protein
MRGKPVCCDDARHALILSVPFLLLLWLFPSSFGQRACSQTSSSQTSTDPNKLVRRVIANELKSQEQDHRHWSFRLNTEKPHGQTEVDEVVETKVGDLKRPLLINGREPGSEQQQEASQRIRQLAQNPAPLRKARQEDDQDTFAASDFLMRSLSVTGSGEETSSSRSSPPTRNSIRRPTRPKYSTP